MKTQVFFPRAGKAFRSPHVAHGFTTTQVGALTAVLQQGNNQPIQGAVVTRATPGGTHWAARFVIVANQAGRYNFVLSDGARTLITIRNVKVRRPGVGVAVMAAPPAAAAAAGGLSIQSPGEGTTVYGHESILASGSVAAPNVLTEATLEYLDDQTSFEGLIVKNDDPWIASFTCPGMFGSREVSVSVKDSANNTDDIECTVTEPLVEHEVSCE